MLSLLWLFLFISLFSEISHNFIKDKKNTTFILLEVIYFITTMWLIFLPMYPFKITTIIIWILALTMDYINSNRNNIILNIIDNIISVPLLTLCIYHLFLIL